MYDFTKLVQHHRDTYYNFASNKQNPFWLPKIYQAAFAIFCAICFSAISDALLQSILTIYSILVGFSFSVLFHLISQREFSIDTDGLLETELRLERLTKLHDEIFYNVTYFIISSLALVAIVLCYYVALSFNHQIFDVVSSVLKGGGVLEYLSTILSFLFSMIMYFLVLETGFLFIRIVGRVTYYFQQKIRHNL